MKDWGVGRHFVYESFLEIDEKLGASEGECQNLQYFYGNSLLLKSLWTIQKDL